MKDEDLKTIKLMFGIVVLFIISIFVRSNIISWRETVKPYPILSMIIFVLVSVSLLYFARFIISDKEKKRS